MLSKEQMIKRMQQEFEEQVEQEEQKIFEEFKELGYEIKINNDNVLKFIIKDEDIVLKIDKNFKEYKKFYYDGIKVPENITLQEHQLLHKLFELLGWFDE